MWWTTPFECLSSALVTVALAPAASVRTILPHSRVAVSVPPPTLIRTALPLPVSIALPMTSTRMVPGRMWLVRTLVSWARDSGFIQLSAVPDGSLPNASSSGTSTVYGPGPARVASRPADLAAAKKRLFWSMPAAIVLALAESLASPDGAAFGWSALSQALSARAAAAIPSASTVLVMPKFLLLFCLRNGPATHCRAIPIHHPNDLDDRANERRYQLGLRVDLVDVAVVVTVPGVRSVVILVAVGERHIVRAIAHRQRLPDAQAIAG